jgi:hypothetical protein
MKVLTARVVDGRVELGDEIAEGTTVAILAPDRDAGELSAAESGELSEALAEIQSGDFESGMALLREIRTHAGS